jgi:hypothetical protein
LRLAARLRTRHEGRAAGFAGLRCWPISPCLAAVVVLSVSSCTVIFVGFLLLPDAAHNGVGQFFRASLDCERVDSRLRCWMPPWSVQGRPQRIQGHRVPIAWKATRRIDSAIPGTMCGIKFCEPCSPRCIRRRAVIGQLAHASPSRSASVMSSSFLPM